MVRRAGLGDVPVLQELGCLTRRAGDGPRVAGDRRRRERAAGQLHDEGAAAGDRPVLPAGGDARKEAEPRGGQACGPGVAPRHPAFWRVPAAAPSGLRSSISQSATSAGMRGGAALSRATTARPAVSLPWIAPTTRTRTAASPSPMRVRWMGSPRTLRPRADSWTAARGAPRAGGASRSTAPAASSALHVPAGGEVECFLARPHDLPRDRDRAAVHLDRAARPELAEGGGDGFAGGTDQ